MSAINDKLHQYSLAINDAELAIGNIKSRVELFSNSNPEIYIKVKLADMQQIVRCFPALNHIVNAPDFTCRKDEDRGPVNFDKFEG